MKYSIVAVIAMLYAIWNSAVCIGNTKIAKACSKIL